MRKVIITENQRTLMEDFFIFEQGADDEKKKKLESFGADLKKNIATQLPKLEIGTILSFTFGLTTEDNKIDPENTVTYTGIVVEHGLTQGAGEDGGGKGNGQDKTKLYNSLTNFFKSIVNDKNVLGGGKSNTPTTKDAGNINAAVNKRGENMQNADIGESDLSLITEADGGGKTGVHVKIISKTGKSNTIKSLPANLHILIPYNNSVNVGAAGARLNFYVVKNIEAKKPSLTPTNVDHLLGFGAKPNENGLNVSDSEVDSESENATSEAISEWDDRIDKILNGAEFTPALFHMNNFFFFPKGYDVMDDIIRKWHLPNVKPSRAVEDNNKSTFTLTGHQIKTKSGKELFKRKQFSGVIFRNENYIGVTNDETDEKLVLQYTPGVKMVQGQEIEVNAIYLAKGVTNPNEGEKVGKTKIKILKF